MLEGVQAVDLVSLREEEPEVVEGLFWDKLKLGKSVLVGGGSSEVGNKRVDGCFS
jgi:hypothetical protein